MYLTVVGDLPDDFGCHPVGRPDERHALLCVHCELRGDAKVGELDVAVGGEQDVGG